MLFPIGFFVDTERQRQFQYKQQRYTPLILATMLGQEVVIQVLLYHKSACPRYSPSYSSLLQQKWYCIDPTV